MAWRLAGAPVAALLVSCGSPHLVNQTPSNDIAVYVVLGSGGAPLVRTLVAGSTCPSIRVDGSEQQMAVRAAPADPAPRQPQMAMPDYQAVHFPQIVCELQLPAHVLHASLDGRPLPLPRAQVDRIVVIGDTGCRVKRTDHAFQRCDRDGFRFDKIAAAAAKLKPDLVIHVGDYHYRENSCPENAVDCYTTSWGYGWDAWRDDFFQPARPLLQAAPWVAVRGNHEMCSRAGQGWWRYLAAGPLRDDQNCDRTAQDGIGNFSDAYAVPIGPDSQLIVLDSADAGDPSSSARYAATAEQIDRLARGATFNIVLVHHPILGLASTAPSAAPRLAGGTATLDAALASHNPDLLPASVQMILSGHVHVWEQVSFGDRLPTQFIAGISGTLEESAASLRKLKDTPVPNLPPIVSSSAWLGGFGFMSMDRVGAGLWDVRLWDEDGRLMNRCQVQGRQSFCSKGQVNAAP